MPTNFSSRTCVLLAAVTLACAQAATVPAAGELTGGPSARHAVEQFLAAVRAQDIQAMSVVWGTSRGPTRNTIERNELERRAIIMQCFLAHDQFRILSESPGDAGRRLFQVELTRGQRTRTTTFTAIVGPGDRWYVENVDLAAIRDFCGDEAPPAR